MRFEQITNSPKNRLKRVLETLKNEYAITINFSSKKDIAETKEVAEEIVTLAKDVYGDNLSEETHPGLGASYLVLEAIKLYEEVQKVNEADIQKAEYLLASKDIVDQIQKVVQNMSDVQSQKIPAIVDRMKLDAGMDAAENYKTTASALISSLIDSLNATKDGMDNLTLGLSGDVDMATAPGAAQAPEMEPEMPAAEPEAAPEPEEEPQLANPLGRERKEESKKTSGKKLTEVSKKKPTNSKIAESTVKKWHVTVKEGNKVIANNSVKAKSFAEASTKMKNAILAQKGLTEWDENYEISIKPIRESWGEKMHTAAKDKGKWEGWTKQELEHKLSTLKKKTEHTEEDTKTIKQIEFALRAKGKGKKHTAKWGKVKEDIDNAEMAKNSLQTIARVSKELEDAMQSGDEMPEWAIEKLGQAKGMIVSLTDYAISKKERNADNMSKVDEAASRKHFRATADIIKSMKDPEERKEHAKRHAENFAAQNPRFDHNRFMQACGVNEDFEKSYDDTGAQINNTTKAKPVFKTAQKKDSMKKEYDDMGNQINTQESKKKPSGNEALAKAILKADDLDKEEAYERLGMDFLNLGEEDSLAAHYESLCNAIKYAPDWVIRDLESKFAVGQYEPKVTEAPNSAQTITAQQKSMPSMFSKSNARMPAHDDQDDKMISSTTPSKQGTIPGMPMPKLNKGDQVMHNGQMVTIASDDGKNVGIKAGPNAPIQMVGKDQIEQQKQNESMAVNTSLQAFGMGSSGIPNVAMEDNVGENVKNSRKIQMQILLHNGKKGKKTFECEDHAKDWIKQHGHKVKHLQILDEKFEEEVCKTCHKPQTECTCGEVKEDVVDFKSFPKADKLPKPTTMVPPGQKGNNVIQMKPKMKASNQEEDAKRDLFLEFAGHVVRSLRSSIDSNNPVDMKLVQKFVQNKYSKIIHRILGWGWTMEDIMSELANEFKDEGCKVVNEMAAAGSTGAGAIAQTPQPLFKKTKKRVEEDEGYKSFKVILDDGTDRKNLILSARDEEEAERKALNHANTHWGKSGWKCRATNQIIKPVEEDTGKIKVTAISAFKKPQVYYVDTPEEAQELKAELKDQQYKVEIEESIKLDEWSNLVKVEQLYALKKRDPFAIKMQELGLNKDASHNDIESKLISKDKWKDALKENDSKINKGDNVKVVAKGLEHTGKKGKVVHSDANSATVDFGDRSHKFSHKDLKKHIEEEMAGGNYGIVNGKMRIRGSKEWKDEEAKAAEKAKQKPISEYSDAVRVEQLNALKKADPTAFGAKAKELGLPISASREDIEKALAKKASNKKWQDVMRDK